MFVASPTAQASPDVEKEPAEQIKSKIGTKTSATTKEPATDSSTTIIFPVIIKTTAVPDNSATESSTQSPVKVDDACTAQDVTNVPSVSQKQISKTEDRIIAQDQTKAQSTPANTDQVVVQATNPSKAPATTTPNIPDYDSSKVTARGWEIVAGMHLRCDEF